MADSACIATPPYGAATAAFLAGAADLGLFMGGRWERSTAGERIEVINPATGETIAAVAAAGEADVDRAVAGARTAFAKGPWPTMASSARSAILLRLADLLVADIDRLAELETLDNGMSLQNARGSVHGAAGLLRYYAGWIGKVDGEVHDVEGWNPADEVTAFSRREPIGVVAQILPWNFPLAILAMKLAPALAAGCTVIVKPAEDTPLTALAFAELAQAAGLPAGVLSVLNGRGEVVGAALAAHDAVDKISFTGSTEVGRRVLKAAAGNLKKVSLELGGKAPLIVIPDADLDKAAAGIVIAAFGNQGQNCVCASRIYVHASVVDAVIERVRDRVERMTLGDGFSDADIGPLVSRRQRDRVMDYVRIGEAEGATLAIGGGAVEGEGFFMHPVVFTGVHGGMRIMREEIFGPVTCIQAFDTLDIDEIAALANDTPYGLIASIWTSNVSTAHRLASRIKAGTVSINAHAHPGYSAPFGGYKQSGWGREFGKAAMESYLETKTVAIYT
jgi:phenylacetaldehyde dehydrogenase